ncbi:MAG: hydroxymethylbilane synthase [Deltaproteobacteria bacterium]|nr:hydroxymethylbilane synthase [Deltaproteobacteria bacterium]
MKRSPLKIGSRGSRLALVQAHQVGKALLTVDPHLTLTYVIIRTTGDHLRKNSVAALGGKGIFVKEIEEALVQGKIDMAVHSMKDVPATLEKNLILAAVLKRTTSRDVFLSFRYASLERLPKEGVVATGSIRRKIHVLEAHPALRVVMVRGNVDTRIQKLKEGHFDALILAEAAIQRLNLAHDLFCQPLHWIPAVGQGTIGIEICRNRKDLVRLLSNINHVKTFHEVTLERFFMKIMQGGCAMPLGAKVFCKGQDFFLTTFIGTLDAKKILRHKIRGLLKNAEGLISKLCQRIMKEGGRDILESVIRGAKKSS